MAKSGSGLTARLLPAGVLANVPAVAMRFGVDAWPVLEAHGVTPELLEHNPLTPLPIEVHGRIVDTVAAATACDHLGLLLGQYASLGNTGPLRFLVVNAGTVGEALDAVGRFSPIWYRGIASTISVADGYVARSIIVDGTFPGSDQLLTAYLVAHVKIVELLLARSWRPTLVRISYREPASSELYRRFFRAPVHFNEPRHEVLFPEELLQQRVSGTDPELRQFFHGHLQQLQTGAVDDIVGQVRRVVESMLPSGDCSVDRIAQFFAVHRITLYRHLARGGTTFEEIVDQTRHRLAEQLLSQTDLPLVEISRLLGYGNQSALTRAFRRWRGTTPLQWRRELGTARL
ncbi:AraC family transcriptional regulator [Rhodococcus olei]|uniref:AraC family transcriptional regulator n=1 Tax=Rhodococcus olei TaxID=2161675 RepID=A0ABP8PSM0_9NOCA